MVSRLAERNQGPKLRAVAEAEFLGEQPAFNTIAEVRGRTLPDEYVLMSAHFDTWDGGTGGTDNSSGTIIMMEALRILRAVYPNPKRTIVVGHWNSEEQGLNGSGAYAADHPEVLDGMQALFNQDNGTGRVTSVSAPGLLGAPEFLGRWVGQLPDEMTRNLSLSIPGNPSSGGSDHASFACSGAPAFSLGSEGWDYFNYTWHTNLDTFDKVVIENVQWNAVLTAMLVYLASEDSERMPRERRIPSDRGREGSS
jgi:Zn-dependent M28 family amino/carboxypeptidase